MAGEELVGPAPSGWKYKTLGAACEDGGGHIQTGPFGSQLHASDYVADGVPYIMPQNIGDNRIIEYGIARITPEDALRLSRYLVRTGDIVYSRRGDVERRALVRDREDGWLCGTGCLRIRLGERGADPRYASYYLGHPLVREWIVRHAHGATMPNLNTSILAACPFLEPPLAEQRAIAHILGTLDDKIELNRRMSETLEAMARRLFKSWFVDFDPVRAKMNLPSPSGRGAGGGGSRPEERRGEGTRSTLRPRAPLPEKLLDDARTLRRQATDAETLLWRLLRGRQIANAKFRRQQPFPPYILDFYCHELKLAVELDGGQHNEDAARRRDARREEYLAERGVRVLRFWNHDVLTQTEAVLEAIYQAVVERAGESAADGVPSPPAPLPTGEGWQWPQHILDLFPNRLVDPELGEIPEGWEVKSLDEIARFLNGLALQKSPPVDGRSLPVIKIAQLRAGNTAGADRASADLDADYIVKDGDILFSWSGSLECVLWAGGEGALNQHLFKVTSATYPRWLCYLGVHAHLDDFRHIAAGKATTMGHIQRHHLSDAKLAVPSPRLLDAMSEHLAPMIDSLWRRKLESRTLAALRDALLPKLISGELRVKDAERFLEKVMT
jgi:type I restriction enzyme S subunit